MVPPAPGRRGPWRRPRRLFRRAAHLIARANQAPTGARVERKLDRVSTLLGKAARAVQDIEAKNLSPGCRARLLDRIGAANLRTLCLAAALAL